MTWPPPDPAPGAAPEPRPLAPAEFADPEFALGELPEEPGAAGRADADGDGLDVRAAVPDGAGLPAPCAGPGRVRATVPAVMTPAAATMVVTERILA